MISRVAENCFWMFRYIERTESLARLIAVQRMLLLDTDVEQAEWWKPVIVVIGEQQRYEELLGTKCYSKDRQTLDYLVWSDQNPISLRSSIYWARENARMSREVISREMWEALNTTWQWFSGAEGRGQFRRDASHFYQRVRAFCAEFVGVTLSTMLQDEPFDFMQLGLHLERANQTARLMDVRHHRVVAAEQSAADTPWQSALWAGQLRLCAAVEPFFKTHRSAPTGPRVTKFLLQAPTFPRSVHHCYGRVVELLEHIESATERREASQSRLLAEATLARLEQADLPALVHSGLHAELTDLVNQTAALGNQLHAEFFDPGGIPSAQAS